MGEKTTFSSEDIQRVEPLLSNRGMQEAAKDLFGGEYPAIIECGVRPVGGRDSIELLEDLTNKSVAIWGVRSCQLTKFCPYCSRREARRASFAIANAIKSWQARGKMVLFLTLTIPHLITDRLSNLRLQLNRTMANFRRRKTLQGLKKQGLLFGEIRKQEVTYSPAHGWGPHFHLLLFIEREYRAAEIQLLAEGLAEDWSGAYESVSQRPFVSQHMLDRGVHLREVGCDDALGTASYLAKSAMAAGRAVISAFGQPGDAQTYNPGDLLMLAALGNQQAADLLKEYAVAMKGAQQLIWSKGLKKKLGIVEKEIDNRDDVVEPRRQVFAKIKATDWLQMVQLGLLAGLKTMAAFGRQWVLAYLGQHGVAYELVEAENRSSPAHVLPQIQLASARPAIP